MPLHQRIKTDKETEIWIWHIDEGVDQLRKDLRLSEADQNRFEKRKSTNHQKGFLATRKLLVSAGIPPNNLSHNNDGIPELETGQHISISHAKTVAAIALGKDSLGIDVETYRTKIQTIAPRFLHTAEGFALAGELSIEKLTLVWTAKEALYKALKQKGIDFSQQLCVAPFQWGDNKGSAKVIFPDKTLNFSLNFVIENDYCATLATHKK